jgi:hypothetical protein
MGACGVAFLALVAGADNIEKYLYLSGTASIIAGTVVVGAWAYEMYCVGDER